MTSIKAAALKLKDGTVLFKPPPARHSSLYLSSFAHCYVGCVDGFLTSEGEFVDRDTAYGIAKRANQLLRSSEDNEVHRPYVTSTPGTLYTEDLW